MWRRIVWPIARLLPKRAVFCARYCSTNAHITTAEARNIRELVEFFDGPTQSQPIKQSSKHVGLFGVPFLKLNGDPVKSFASVTQNAIRRCEAISKQIFELDAINETGSQDLNIVRLLDQLSETLCETTDPMDLCRAIHTQPQVREAADRAFADMQSFIHALNTNDDIYHIATRIAKRHTDGVTKNLDQESYKLVTQLIAEFQTSGIHLPPDKREAVSRLLEELNELSSNFSQGIADLSSDHRRTVTVPLSAVEHILPPSLLHRLERPSDSTIALPLLPSVTSLVLRDAEDADVRRAVYIASNTPPRTHLETLHQMLRKRHQLATTLGFPSYAHYATQSAVLNSPEAVRSFLDDLSEKLKPAVSRELEALSLAKKALRQPEPDTIYEWDISFLKHQLLEAVVTEHNEHSDDCSHDCAHDVVDTNPLLGYLTVGRAVAGISLVMSRLFGAVLRPSAMAADEAWAPNVCKLAVEHETEGRIGTIYCDLFARRDRLFGEGTMAIRHPSRWCPPAGAAVAVVCSIAEQRSRTLPAFMSQSELDVLFHEFGHVLAHLFSRTQYQHFAGTRVAWDFVETPSTLMERFARDTRILQLIGRHYETGEPPNDSVMQHYNALAAVRMPAVETQLQLVHAMADQALHGSDLTAITDSVATFAAVQNQYTKIPYAERTAEHAYVRHFINYAGTYYSYLYSRMLSANIWYKRFVDDPLSRYVGEEYRKHILAPAGAGEPLTMLRRMLSGEPAVGEFLKEFGIFS